MTWKKFPNLTRRGQISYLTMADGTTLRTACWPSVEDSPGMIVLVGGLREYMEKYTEFISDFLERGFAVYTFDNRGQGLSDRPLPDRDKSHAENFTLFSNDLDEFIVKVVKTDYRAKKLPIYLIGHSLGGHICLRYLHDFPGTVAKAVLMAPMIDFYMGVQFVKIAAKIFIRLASRLGLRKNFAPGQGNSPSKKHDLIRQGLLTHDKERYAIEAEIIRANPDLYVGDATFGWLDMALDSIAKTQESGFVATLTLPILVFLAGKDRVVDSAASRKLFSGYDNIDVALIDGARHEIYRESDEYRRQLWHKIDAFLTVE